MDKFEPSSVHRLVKFKEDENFLWKTSMFDIYDELKENSEIVESIAVVAGGTGSKQQEVFRKIANQTESIPVEDQHTLRNVFALLHRILAVFESLVVVKKDDFWCACGILCLSFDLDDNYDLIGVSVSIDHIQRSILSIDGKQDAFRVLFELEKSQPQFAQNNCQFVAKRPMGETFLLNMNISKFTAGMKLICGDKEDEINRLFQRIFHLGDVRDVGNSNGTWVKAQVLYEIACQKLCCLGTERLNHWRRGRKTFKTMKLVLWPSFQTIGGSSLGLTDLCSNIACDLLREVLTGVDTGWASTITDLANSTRQKKMFLNSESPKVIHGLAGVYNGADVLKYDIMSHFERNRVQEVMEDITPGYLDRKFIRVLLERNGDCFSSSFLNTLKMMKQFLVSGKLRVIHVEKKEGDSDMTGVSRFLRAKFNSHDFLAMLGPSQSTMTEKSFQDPFSPVIKNVFGVNARKDIFVRDNGDAIDISLWHMRRIQFHRIGDICEEYPLESDEDVSLDPITEMANTMKQYAHDAIGMNEKQEVDSSQEIALDEDFAFETCKEFNQDILDEMIRKDNESKKEEKDVSVLPTDKGPVPSLPPKVLNSEEYLEEMKEYEHERKMKSIADKKKKIAEVLKKSASTPTLPRSMKLKDKSVKTQDRYESMGSSLATYGDTRRTYPTGNASFMYDSKNIVSLGVQQETGFLSMNDFTKAKLSSVAESELDYSKITDTNQAVSQSSEERKISSPEESGKEETKDVKLTDTHKSHGASSSRTRLYRTASPPKMNIRTGLPVKELFGDRMMCDAFRLIAKAHAYYTAANLCHRYHESRILLDGIIEAQSHIPATKGPSDTQLSHIRRIFKPIFNDLPTDIKTVFEDEDGYISSLKRSYDDIQEGYKDIVLLADMIRDILSFPTNESRLLNEWNTEGVTKFLKLVIARMQFEIKQDELSCNPIMMTSLFRALRRVQKDGNDHHVSRIECDDVIQLTVKLMAKPCLAGNFCGQAGGFLLKACSRSDSFSVVTKSFPISNFALYLDTVYYRMKNNLAVLPELVGLEAVVSVLICLLVPRRERLSLELITAMQKKVVFSINSGGYRGSNSVLASLSRILYMNIDDPIEGNSEGVESGQVLEKKILVLNGLIVSLLRDILLITFQLGTDHLSLIGLLNVQAVIDIGQKFILVLQGFHFDMMKNAIEVLVVLSLRGIDVIRPLDDFVAADCKTTIYEVVMNPEKYRACNEPLLSLLYWAVSHLIDFMRTEDEEEEAIKELAVFVLQFICTLDALSGRIRPGENVCLKTLLQVGFKKGDIPSIIKASTGNDPVWFCGFLKKQSVENTRRFLKKPTNLLEQFTPTLFFAE